MRKLGWSLFLIFALFVEVAHGWNYLAFEQITVGATAIGFTSSLIRPTATAGAAGSTQATIAQCRLETAEIRYRFDTTAATSQIGTLLEIGDVLTLTGNDALNNFKAVATGSSSGQLDCTYLQP